MMASRTFLVLTAMLVLAGCGGPIEVPVTAGDGGSARASDILWACATVDPPHTVYDPTVCPASRTAVETLEETAGIEVKWYSARRADVDTERERAQVGEPLPDVWLPADPTSEPTTTRSRVATATETP
jgi:ABC-type glycerol-3-phosphate transport system substrate-binding protein